MQLEILTPDQSLFSGEVNGVQLPGVDGLFEILENHAPMIAALSAGIIKVKSSEGEQEIEISSGIVECLQNHVSVLVEGKAEN